MKLSLDQISDWNPQLFRELKGRIKTQNLAITAGISLLGQLGLMIAFSLQLPFFGADGNKYCYEDYLYNGYKLLYYIPSLARCHDPETCPCDHDGAGHVIVNWYLWWYDIFLWLSFIGVAVLLLVGTYMLIRDLANEERLGTLNFLRLTPQSSHSILLGKMLGVPVLLYLAVMLATPLHFWAGIAGGISLSRILIYDGAVVACCIFFYSAAMLFGLLNSWMSGFQAWLGSGLVLSYLWIDGMVLSSYWMGNAIDLINLFNPWLILPCLLQPITPDLLEFFKDMGLRLDFLTVLCIEVSQSFQWFYLPVGASFVSLVGFMVFNFSLWTYWMWQCLNRRFRNPGATWLSKRQSYTLVACFEGMALGFALQEKPNWHDWILDHLSYNLAALVVMNIVLGLCLIVTLSPQRQSLIDWARYRHTEGGAKGLWQDLVFAEKSPAPVAIYLSFLGISLLLAGWILLWPAETHKLENLALVCLTALFVSIVAVVVQMILLMESTKQTVWAAVIVGGGIILPPIILLVLSVDLSDHTLPWLFTVFSWAVIGIGKADLFSILAAIIGQLSILAGLSFWLTRQLLMVGESASKALLEAK